MSLASERLALSLAAASVVVKPLLTAGAQVSTAKPVTIQLQDLAGDSVARVQRLECTVRRSDGLQTVVGEVTLSETGVGVEVTTTAKATLIITTDANGAATLTLTNASGGALSNMHLVVQPIDLPGVRTSLLISLT